MNGLLKLTAATSAVILLGGVGAMLLVPDTPEKRAMLQHLSAQLAVDEIHAAIWEYRQERGEFPPGDGHGSAALATALARIARSGRPYYDGLRGRAGDLANPFDPEGSVLHYRNNAAVPNQAARNASSFDLWGRGVGGEEGLNNWGSSVPLP